jgi:DNA polymerase
MPNPILHIDLETRSTVDLTKTGQYVYAADPTTDVWCAAYAFDDEPVQLWQLGDPVPGDIAEHVLLGNIIYAHNAAFERVIWHYVLSPRYGWPEPELAQWRCTMVMARALGLPASLEHAAPAVGLDVEKDMKGRRLMLQMAKPRKTKDKKLTWWDQPEKIERLCEYCKQDVEVERQLDKRLRSLSKKELALWHLDQKINDRGVKVDVALADAAKTIVERAQDELDKQMAIATGYEVTACSNRNQIIAWLQAQGLELDSIKKENIELLLDDPDLPPHIRKVLTLRLDAAKASVAKIDALLRGMSKEDDRAKGLLQFHAANTGRWGGRRFQPQNLKRPDEDDIDLVIEAVATGDYDYVELLFGSPLAAVADILRGLLVASPDHRIMAADYSNIEGRVLAWLANEQWKVEAFEDFDRGEGPDLYIKSYAETFNVPIFDKKDPRRHVGKVMELASGYQGGHGAYLKFGLTEEKLNDLCDTVEVAVDPEDWKKAEEKYDGGHGLSKRHWTGLRIVIDKWRAKHANTKVLWFEMEEAAISAVESPGDKFQVGRVTFQMLGSFLVAHLPSKRQIVYPYPETRWTDAPWTETVTKEVTREDGTVETIEVEQPAKKLTLTYMSELDVTKRSKLVYDPRNTSNYGRIKTYAGMLVENAVQGIARDILAYAMPKLEEAGYPIILTVHDEIVCEVPDGRGSVQEMEQIMCDLPKWAEGLPVAAEGFEGERYRK